MQFIHLIPTCSTNSFKKQKPIFAPSVGKLEIAIFLEMFVRISRSSGQRRCPQDAIVRWFASSKKGVINTRTMQRQLFGQAVGEKDKKRFIPSTGHSANCQLDDSWSKAGEIYWMGLRSKNVKTFRADSSTAKTSPKRDRDLSTAKAKLTEQGVPNRCTNVSIPFDDDQLRTIPTYAMNCVKADISLVDGLLADKSIRLPSVSRILQATMSDGARAALKRWKLQKIDELGYDGFQLYQQDILSTGKHFHSILERYLGTGEVPESTSPAIKLWQSLGDHLTELNPKALLIEKPIIHPYLKYQGIIDNVSLIK